MAFTRWLAGLASVALLVLGLVALLPDCASACSCAMIPGSQQERAELALAESTAVFSGEVVDLSKGKPTTVFFRVPEVWKGPERGTLEVTTSSQESACGYPFSEGRKYLVYADDGMSVNLCGETKPLSDAGADFRALGDGQRPGGKEPLPDTSGEVPVSGVLALAGLAATTAAFLLSRRLLES